MIDGLPGFPDNIETGRDGRLWVERYGGVARTEREWAVFDADGQWIARLRMPLEMEPLEFGADYVLVSTTDALDRELVQLHDLVTG